MNPFLHILLFLIILFTAGWIRYWPRRIVPNPTSTDTVYHLYLIKLIRENNHRVPRYLERLTIKGRLSKPYLFYWMFSYLNPKHIPGMERSLSAFCDMVNISIVYGLGLYISADVFGTPWSPVSLYATVLLAVSPGLLRQGIGPRTFQGTPRIFSQTLYLIHIALFYFASHTASPGLWILASLTGGMVIMSGKFAIQVISFFGIFIAAFFSTGYLAVFLGAWLFVCVGTLGRIYTIMKDHCFHLSFYAKKMQQKRLWGNPYFHKSFSEFISLWKSTFSSFSKGNGPHILINSFLNETFFPFLLLFFFTPVLIALVLPLTAAPAASLVLPFVLTLAAFVTGSLIKFKYLLFLGEAERYLEYGMPFATLVCAVIIIYYNLGWLLTGLLMYSVMVLPFQYNIFFQKFGKWSHDYDDIKKLFALLDLRPKGNVLSISVPWYPLYLSKQPIARVNGFDPKLSGHRNALYFFGQRGNHISPRIPEMINRYDVAYLYGEKNECYRYLNLVAQKFRLPFLKKIDETQTSMLFEVRQEYRGRLKDREVSASIRLRPQNLPSEYFRDVVARNVHYEKQLPLEALLLKASQASAAMHWPDAAFYWKMLEHYYPGQNPMAPVKYARAMRHLLDFDQAEKIIRDEISKEQVLLYAMAEYAELAMARGQWEEAVARWKELDLQFPCLWNDLPSRLATAEYMLQAVRADKNNQVS